jgi:nitrile hydratase
MDGIHDMGGMHGFGAIQREADEPVFHADWEGRVFALDLLVEAFVEGANIDAFRHAIERLDPVTYLDASYYEKWALAVESLIVDAGVVSRAEIAERIAALRQGGG